MNHIVWIVFDSARHDTFAAAATPNLDRIAAAERRFSYASWTAPSHYAFLMGVTPHRSMKLQFASIQYRDDIAQWGERIQGPGCPAPNYKNFLPEMSVPLFLRKLGYRCEAYVSLPVLNPSTVLAAHFDHFELMPRHNDFASILSRVHFGDTPSFYFINAGETHYPYLLPGESAAHLPRISGLHGAFRDLGEFLVHPAASCEAWMDDHVMRGLWQKQVACIEYLDALIGGLLERSPENVWFIVTSDHGELFGEDGYFGHGPIMHEKVFEVFFLEGQRP